MFCCVLGGLVVVIYLRDDDFVIVTVSTRIQVVVRPSWGVFEVLDVFQDLLGSILGAFLGCWNIMELAAQNQRPCSTMLGHVYGFARFPKSMVVGRGACLTILRRYRSICAMVMIIWNVSWSRGMCHDAWACVYFDHEVCPRIIWHLVITKRHKQLDGALKQCDAESFQSGYTFSMSSRPWAFPGWELHCRASLN